MTTELYITLLLGVFLSGFCLGSFVGYHTMKKAFRIGVREGAEKWTPEMKELIHGILHDLEEK